MIIAIVLVIIIVLVLCSKKEHYGYPGDWSLGGYTMQKKGTDRTRIHRGPVMGGIIVSQVIPSMAHTYKIGDEVKPCDLCPNCTICPSCPNCISNT